MLSCARHVIGLGASAGGLTPLMEFVQALPLGQGCACIVVQHLAADQPSVLVQLLQAHSAYQVLTATDGQVLWADHVYVIEPGTMLDLQPSAPGAEAPTLRVQLSPLPTPPLIDALLQQLLHSLDAAAAPETVHAQS